MKQCEEMKSKIFILLLEFAADLLEGCCGSGYFGFQGMELLTLFVLFSWEGSNFPARRMKKIAMPHTYTFTYVISPTTHTHPHPHPAHIYTHVHTHTHTYTGGPDLAAMNSACRHYLIIDGPTICVTLSPSGTAHTFLS